MRTRPFAFALAFAALAPAAGRSADPGPARPDLADLFPARTLLYLEVSDPAALAREARALLKGSTLGDVLAHLPRLRGQGPDFFGPPPAGILGTFLGPEALAEAERFEGAALAVTGLTGGGEPEFVFVLRPGASNLPGFLIRGFLANHPAVRKVGTAEGIDLYQEWYPQFFAPNLAGGPVIPAEEMTPPDGMTYAYAPGAVVIGSGKECVTDVLRRLRGKGKGPGLRQAAGLDRGRRAGPGVFVFADVKRWAEQTEEHYRAAEVVLRPLGWELFQRVVNPAAVRSLTGRLSLEGGNLSLALEARLDPGRRSPLADLCAGAVPGASLPVTAPDDAPLAVTVFLPPAGRAEKLLALADAAAEAFGGLGMLPSEGVRELRQHTGIDAGGAVLGRVGAVTLFLPARQTLPDGAVPLPTVAFHAEADAAEALEELLPAAVGLVAARPAEPVVETIAGQRVRSLPAEGTPWGSALHYGRRGGVLVIGQDRAVVAAALAAGRRDVAPRRESPAVHGGAAVRAFWRWAGMLPAPAEPVPTPGADPARAAGAFAAALLRGAGVRAGGSPATPPAAPTPALDPGSVPPLVVSLRRDGDVLRAEVRQPGLGKVAGPLIDAGLDWLRRASRPEGMVPYADFGPQGILLPPLR